MIKESAIEETKTFTPSITNGEYDIIISWIIIGNQWDDSKFLVEAINKQEMDTKLVELIIIDDCSGDESLKSLKNIDYENKHIITLNKPSGRCKARNHGIKLAKGEFCLFTNSNTIPTANFINQYINDIYQFNIDGAAGVVNYTSNDKYFENYLNHPQRGLKKFCNQDLLSVNYVLFGNCTIKTSLLKQVSGFNEKLIGYGGEEIELLSRIEQIKELIIIKTDAGVLRMNHPNFDEHCKRLIEFGETNFKLLPNQIKSKIIPPFFLKIYKILPTSTLIWKLRLLNRLIGSQNITLMKLIMGLSIVKGYKK